MSSPPGPPHGSEDHGTPNAVDLTGAADNDGAVGGDENGADGSGGENNGRGHNGGDDNAQYEHDCGDPQCTQFKNVSRLHLMAKNMELRAKNAENDKLGKRNKDLEKKLEELKLKKKRHVRVRSPGSHARVTANTT